MSWGIGVAVTRERGLEQALQGIASCATQCPCCEMHRRIAEKALGYKVMIATNTYDPLAEAVGQKMADRMRGVTGQLNEEEQKNLEMYATFVKGLRG